MLIYNVLFFFSFLKSVLPYKDLKFVYNEPSLSQPEILVPKSPDSNASLIQHKIWISILMSAIKFRKCLNKNSKKKKANEFLIITLSSDPINPA